MTHSIIHRRPLAAATAVILGAIATATNPVFVRLADVDLVASAFHRMLWAIPLLWMWTLLIRRRTRSAALPFSRSDRWSIALCGVFFAADLTSLHTSISMTHAANAILFLNAQPIYVVVAGWLLFGTLVTRRFILAALITLSGAAMLAWQSASFGETHLGGDGLGVLAGICYAGYILTAARLRGRRSSAEITLWTSLVGAPLLFVAALVLDQQILPHSARDWALMIALGVISQALGQGLIVWGLAYLPASFSSVALLVAPIAAAVFAWVFLDETLGGLQIVAMAIVLVGIYAAWHTSFATTVAVVDDAEQRSPPRR